MTEVSYTQLVALYRELHEQGLEILAFPCNQFGAQEPGSAEEIKAFVARYNVEFPLFEKTDVNGPAAHPLYQFLRNQAQMQNIEWNFGKFLVSRDGASVQYFTPRTEPNAMREGITQLL